jgi:flagellar biosynthesis GTPase FlhF
VEKSEPIDWGIVAAVVGGLLLVGGGIFFVLRRRALPRDVEVDGFGDEEAFEDRIPAGGFAMDSALGIGGEAEAEEDWTVTAAQPLPAPGADREIPLPEFDVATAPAEASEDAEKESVMDQELQDLPMNRSAMPPPSASMNSSAASSDVSGIVSALERRMSQLEKRLDESNEARERLERQVAAQSEELRVQRAAIARTQRALRSLSRTEEEQATEPALRDPSRPPAPRGPSA